MSARITHMSQHTYTTPTGVTVGITAIPQLQVEMVRANAIVAWQKENGELPSKPTYTITTADGAEETHEHDETTIAEDPIAKLAWDHWLRQHELCDAEVNGKVMDFFLLRGIKADLPTGNEWIEQQAYFGLTVPDDPIERRLHYIRTEVLSGPADIGEIMTRIMELSGTPQEVVERAKATFRGSLRQ